jgi:hypothetical protein
LIANIFINIPRQQNRETALKEISFKENTFFGCSWKIIATTNVADFPQSRDKTEKV